MNDTPEAVQNFYQTLLLRRSGSERVQMGCAMFDTARAFALANLRGLSHSDYDLRARLFVRTYSGDFDPATTQRIAEWLSTPHRVMQEGTLDDLCHGPLLRHGHDILAAPDRNGIGADGGTMMDYGAIVTQVFALLQQ